MSSFQSMYYSSVCLALKHKSLIFSYCFYASQALFHHAFWNRAWATDQNMIRKLISQLDNASQCTSKVLNNDYCEKKNGSRKYISAKITLKLNTEYLFFYFIYAAEILALTYLFTSNKTIARHYSFWVWTSLFPVPVLLWKPGGLWLSHCCDVFIQNILNCVPKMNWDFTGLERHGGKWLTTKFSFWGGVTL